MNRVSPVQQYPGQQRNSDRHDEKPDRYADVEPRAPEDPGVNGVKACAREQQGSGADRSQKWDVEWVRPECRRGDVDRPRVPA